MTTGRAAFLAPAGRRARRVWDRESEFGALDGPRLSPDPAAVELDDALANAQSDPGPGEGVARV